MVKRQNRTTAKNPQNNEALVMLMPIFQLEAAETDLEAVFEEQRPCVRERAKGTSVECGKA